MTPDEIIARNKLIGESLLILQSTGYWDELKREFEQAFLNSLGNKEFNLMSERDQLLGVQRLCDSMPYRAQTYMEANNALFESDE